MSSVSSVSVSAGDEQRERVEAWGPPNANAWRAARTHFGSGSAVAPNESSLYESSLCNLETHKKRSFLQNCNFVAQICTVEL